MCRVEGIKRSCEDAETMLAAADVRFERHGQRLGEGWPIMGEMRTVLSGDQTVLAEVHFETRVHGRVEG